MNSTLRSVKSFGIVCSFLLFPIESSLAELFSTPFAVKVVAPKVTLGSIDETVVDQPVEVQGTIKAIKNPREGSRAPYRINITDDTGSLNLVIWTNMWETLNAQHQLAVGENVRVTAIVSRYRDELQLTIQNATDLEVIGKAEAARPKTSSTSEPHAIVSTAASPAVSTGAVPVITIAPTGSITPLSAINNSLMGSNITVQANITNVLEPTAERVPYRITLSQDKATMLLVYWKDMQELVGPKMRVGNTVRANVTVSNYRDTIQLRLREPQNMQIVSGAASVREAAGGSTNVAAMANSATGAVSVASITEKMTNQTVTISGKIKTAEKLGRGQRVRVQDNSGEIVVWDAASKIPETALKAGRAVTVTGLVKKFRDQLEIQPASADDVKFLD